MKKKCLICKKEYTPARPCLFETSKFCSRICLYQSFSGKKAHNNSRIEKECLYCGEFFQWKDSPSRIKEKKGKYCSRKCSNSSKVGKSSWNNGIKTGPQSLESRLRKSLAQRGEKHYNWQGGKTAISIALRNSFEYEEWRKAVFERDLYTCQGCGEVGGRLEADHIKPWSLFPQYRFDIDNGRTLCKPCHKYLGYNWYKKENY